MTTTINRSSLNLQRQYRGWTYNYDGRRPVSGSWRAEQHGVSMNAGTESQLKRMIDAKIQDRALSS